MLSPDPGDTLSPELGHMLMPILVTYTQDCGLVHYQLSVRHAPEAATSTASRTLCLLWPGCAGHHKHTA